MAEVTSLLIEVGIGVLYGYPNANFSGTKQVGLLGISGDMLRGYGPGKIRGTVERKSDPSNALLQRRVRLYSERTGSLIKETWSNATTGEYMFSDLDTAQRYTAIAYDYEHNFRAVAADNLTPELMP